MTIASTTGGTPGRRRWLTLTTVALAQLMVILDSTVVNIALPSAQLDLGFSDGQRQWVVTAYALAFGSLLLLGGRIADLIGRKPAFVVGLVGFALASVLGGVAPDFALLVVARALQGAFAALLAPTALSVLTTTFSIPRERARAFGIWGAIAAAGGGIGLLLGGFLTEDVGWRWVLYINVPIAIVALVGATFYVHSAAQTGVRATLDVPGTILVSDGLFLLALGFSNAETDGWGSASSWVPLVGSGVLLIAFVLWIRRAAHPLLQLSVIIDRNRGAAYLSILLSSAGMFTLFLFLTYYLQTQLHYTPIQTGLSYLPMVGALVIAAQLSTNLLLPRLGPKVLVPSGMLIGAAGLAWLTNIDLGSTYVPNIMFPLMVFGIAMGLITPASMQIATLGVDRQNAGIASALVNTSQQVGGSIATSLLNTLAVSAVTSYLVDHLPANPTVFAEAAIHSYSLAYWVMVGVFAGGAAISLLLFRGRSRGLAPHNANQETPAVAVEETPVAAL